MTFKGKYPGGDAAGRLAAAAQALLQRHWRRALSLRERVRLSEEAFHLILAGMVGVIGGLSNLFFYTCIDWVQDVVFGRHRDLVEMAEVLAWWQRLLIPAIGGLAAGLILYWGLRLVGRQGPTNLLEVVAAGDGRLPFRSAVVKLASSLVSIGTGASIGREGGIVQMSAMISSKLGQLAKWQPYRLRLLVACGAASGLAAAYNAPVAGAVFAAQIVLGNFSMNLFAPVVFSSVVASMISQNFFAIQPYEVPPFRFTSVTQLPWFVVLGVLSGILGAAFLKLLRRSEDGFARLAERPCLRLAAGGLLVGVIAVFFPTVWGNGYTVIKRILTDQFGWEMLAAVFAAKFLATIITVGSGAVGGVFTPTLFLGAGLGALFSAALRQAGCAEALPAGIFALAGMGGVLAATTRSPLLAMIMMFEMSNYSLMPALMLTTVVSTLVARRLHAESIYTEPLRLKGLAEEREGIRAGVAASERRVGDIMRAPVPPLRESASLREMADRFLTSPNNFIPVVDAQQRLVGVAALQDMKEFLQAGREMDAIIAMDVMRPPPPCLTPNQRLLDTLPVLLASEQKNIPVVNTSEGRKLVGAVVRADALGYLSEVISWGASPEREATETEKPSRPGAPPAAR